MDVEATWRSIWYRQIWSKKMKAEIFLRYTLLPDPMASVYKYGRYLKYKFENDECLSKILNGKHGLEGKTD